MLQCLETFHVLMPIFTGTQCNHYLKFHVFWGPFSNVWGENPSRMFSLGARAAIKITRNPTTGEEELLTTSTTNAIKVEKKVGKSKF